MNTTHNSSSVLHQSRQDQIEVAIVLLKAGATLDVVFKTTALPKAMINEIIIREGLVKPWKIRKQLREAERALKMESNRKSPRNSERDLEIVQLAQSGMTLREIASKMGISSERVRKILKINGAMSPKAVRQQEKAQVQTAIDLVQRSLRDWIKTHMGCTIVELSLGTGVPEIECKSNIPSDVNHLVLSPGANPAANRWTTVKWTDSQVLDAILHESPRCARCDTSFRDEQFLGVLSGLMYQRVHERWHTTHNLKPNDRYHRARAQVGASFV